MKDPTITDFPENKKILLATAAASPESASVLRFMPTENTNGTPSPLSPLPSARALADTWNTDLARTVYRGVAQNAAALGADVLILPAMEPKDTPYRPAVSEDVCQIGELFSAMLQGAQEANMPAVLRGFDRIPKDALIGDRANDLATINEAYLPALRTTLHRFPHAGLLWETLPHNDDALTHAIDRIKGREKFRLINTAGEEDVVHCLNAGHIVLHGDHAFAADAHEKYFSFARAEQKGTASSDDIEQLCRQGLLLNDEAIDRTCGNLLELANACKRPSAPATAEELPLQEVAEESIVMLKNERGTLPLKKRRIALVGNLGAFAELPSHLTNLNLETCVIEGYAPDTDDCLTLTAEQEQQLKACGAILLFLDDRRMKPNSAKLPANRLELIHRLASLRLPIIAVVVGARDLDTRFDHACRALLLIRDPLPQSASALAKILTGRISPSGVLSTGYDEDTDELLRLRKENAAITQTKPRRFFGYKYADTCGLSVKYPFGFGLSFANTEATSFSVSKDGVAIIHLTNRSRYTQKETLQIYASNKNSTLAKPKNELIAFQKVTLAPNKATTVRIPLPKQILPTYDPVLDEMIQEKGHYRLLLCCSGSEAIAQTLFARGGRANRKKEALSDYLSEIPDELQPQNFLEEKELFMKNQKKMTIAASIVLLASLLYGVFFSLLATMGSAWLDSEKLTSLIFFALFVVSLFTCCCAIAVLLSGRRKKRELKNMIEQLKRLQRSNAKHIESDSVKHIFSEAPDMTEQEAEEETATFAAAANDTHDFSYDKHLRLQEVCAGLKTFLAENGFSVGMDALRSILSAMASSGLILMRTEEQTAGNLWAGIAAYFGSYLAYSPIEPEYDEYTIFKRSEIAKNDEDSDRMHFCFYGNATARATGEYFKRLIPYFKSPDHPYTVHTDIGAEGVSYTVSPNTWVIVNLNKDTALADLPEHIRAFAAFVEVEVENTAPAAEKTAFRAVGYYQFRTMTKEGVGKYPVDESSWKKLDHFSAELGEGFRLTNRFWQALELYAAAFLATDGNEDTMLDYLMAQRVLLCAHQFCKGENADKTLRDPIFSAFGDENTAQMLKTAALLAGKA